MLSLFGLCVVAFTICPVRAIPISEAEATRVLRERSPGLIDCLTSQPISFSLPSSNGFAQLAEPYNLRLPHTPAAIVLPNNTDQVSHAVSCALASGTKVQARGGGHSYAAFSIGGKDGSLIVDLQSFQQITVDSSTQIATVGAGVRLGNLAESLYNQGKRALPHGTCPGVGVGGHFTHGGYGFPSRMWGLALDTIVALDVVLANGSYVHATSTSYPEIYFALRGAADSFGIVTTFYLQTQSAPASLVVFSYSIGSALRSKETAADAFLSIQSFSQDSSVVNRKLGLGVNTNGGYFNLVGMYFDSLENFKNNIEPAMLRGLPSVDQQYSTANEMDWLSALENYAGGPLPQPLTGYNQHDTFFTKSIVTQEAHPLEKAALESYFDFLIQNRSHSPSPFYSHINLYGGADSQVNTQSPDSAAYSHRSSMWVFQHSASTANGQPPFTPAIIPFITAMTDSLVNAQPDGQFDAYLNYVDPTLTPAQAHDLYYGPHLYAKLLAIKNEVDPQQVFWNPQAIGTS